MDEPQVEAPAENAEQPKKKKGGMLMKLVIGLVVVCGLGGGAAWWLMGTRTEAAPSEPPLETRGLLSFEPFLVNLTDAGGNRFLKANISLVVESEARGKHIAESAVVMGHLRSTMLELLALQSAPDLVKPEGKEELKKVLKERTSALMKEDKVLDVLFSEFVVQF